MIKRLLIPTLLLSSGVAVASPPPDEEVPAALLELRGDLAEAGEKAALQSVERFRPLCDAEGYPLVGNLLPKSDANEPPPPMYQPSEFCAEVRSSERDA